MQGDAVRAKIIGTAETTEYSYDNNGNLIAIKDPKGITTLEYDYENRLTKVTKPDNTWVRFTYDPFGRRYSKETSTGEKEIYIYDGLHIMEVYDGNTMQLKSSFIHSDIIDEVLFGNIQGQDLYYHQDGLNSVKALTDGVGNVVTSYDYDAWGNPVGSLPAIMNPFTFTGREWDKETGLYYYRARYYDAKVGRFVSEDPIGLAGGDINLYSYVWNRPTMFIDPWGLSPSLSDCISRCAADQFGITTLLGATGAGLGAPILAAGGKPEGATQGTSIASKYLSKWFPQKIGSTWAPTLKNPLAKSAVLGRVLGRWVPVVGWGLLAYDAIKIGQCVDECMSDNECESTN